MIISTGENMLQRIKTKKFWISFVSIVIMLLQLFGVKVDAPYINEVVNSICAVLILLGLLDPGQDDPIVKDDGEITDEGKTDERSSNDLESENDISDGQ